MYFKMCLFNNLTLISMFKKKENKLTLTVNLNINQ